MNSSCLALECVHSSPKLISVGLVLDNIKTLLFYVKDMRNPPGKINREISQWEI